MLFSAFKKAGACTVAALAVAGTIAVTASSASAAAPSLRGYNGQQVTLCGGKGGTAQITGTNQWGNIVTSPTIALNREGCTEAKGWWWKGKITVTWHASQGDRTKSYTVPVNQTSNFHRVDY